MKLSNHTLIATAVATLLSAAAVTAQAADANAGKEQCAGVIRAGQNDCATSTNACHSHVTVDNHPEAWIYLPKGTCQKISGARVVKVVDPTPAKKKG